MLNTKETEQIKSERATLILQSIEKSTQDRERIGIVFDPTVCSEDKNWRTELLEQTFGWIVMFHLSRLEIWHFNRDGEISRSNCRERMVIRQFTSTVKS